MAENSKLTAIELNGVRYTISKSIYEELDMTLVRFVELLGRDFYCPTLSQAPTSTTLTYVDTDGEQQSFQIGQPCRWSEGGVWKIAFLKDNANNVAQWLVVPTEDDLEGKQDKNMYFYNVKAENWVADTTYQGYTHRCDIPCTGVTADHHAEVLFAYSDASSGNYAPVCETKNGYVSIWGNKTDTIIVSTIIIQK